jgi:rhodanese-related sulfurtransferase
MRRITAPELSRLLATAETPPVLLDVREPHEFAYCHIDGSLNIPMHLAPERLIELDPDAEIIAICHHGMRSQMVADYLEGQGFKNLVNLTGGVDAWAVLVDPAMPRY